MFTLAPQQPGRFWVAIQPSVFLGHDVAFLQILWLPCTVPFTGHNLYLNVKVNDCLHVLALQLPGHLHLKIAPKSPDFLFFFFFFFFKEKVEFDWQKKKPNLFEELAFLSKLAFVARSTLCNELSSLTRYIANKSLFKLRCGHHCLFWVPNLKLPFLNILL